MLSQGIVEGYEVKRSSVVIITHNLELAERCRELKLGQFLQGEFVDGNPTHKMVPGISLSSHALRIAQKIGFSTDDIKKHLRTNGYV